MPSRIEDIEKFLREYGRIVGFALGGSAAVPLIAYFSKIVPPAPDGIILVSSLVQLVALVLSYQLFTRSSRANANRFMKIYLGLLGVFFILYLTLISFFTYRVVQEGIAVGPRIAKGFSCQPWILESSLGEQCPFVGVSALKDAQWDAENIWLEWSISAIEFALGSTWIVFFFLLSMYFGVFIAHQRSRR